MRFGFWAQAGLISISPTSEAQHIASLSTLHLLASRRVSLAFGRFRYAISRSSRSSNQVSDLNSYMLEFHKSVNSSGVGSIPL